MSKQYLKIDHYIEEKRQRDYKAALEKLDKTTREQVLKALSDDADDKHAKPSNHLELDEQRIAETPQPQREETITSEQAEWIASDPLAMSLILLRRADPYATIRQLASRAKTSKSRVDRYFDKIGRALPQANRLLGRLSPRALSQQARRAREQEQEGRQGEQAKGQAL